MEPIIKDINCLIVDIPTIRPHKLSVATMGTQSMVIVRILASDEVEGIGEATTIAGLHYGGESPESIKTNIDTYFRPLLQGKPANQIAALRELVAKNIKENRFAKAAIETALYDARAKRLGVSISDMFGGRVHDSISVAWTLASGDTQADIAEAHKMLDLRRHNIFKLKIGIRQPQDDIKHVDSIKKAVGDDVSIRVDINQGWTETQAVRYLPALADVGVELVEQPIHYKNLAGMARLTALGRVPIMADEALQGPHDAFRLAAEHCANVFAIKIEQAGGLQAARDLISIAEAADISLYGGTMLEGSIATVAAAHLFSTIARLEWGSEMFGPLLLRDEILKTPLDYREFALKLPTGPGLGIELDDEKLAFYARKF